MPRPNQASVEERDSSKDAERSVADRRVVSVRLPAALIDEIVAEAHVAGCTLELMTHDLEGSAATRIAARQGVIPNGAPRRHVHRLPTIVPLGGARTAAARSLD